MNEVILILKKEIKSFTARKAMMRWYLWIICINIFMLLIPKYDFLPITQNKALLCIVFMMFSVLLVPNNLSLDLIGGEKYHKTLETLISTSINVRKAFWGKVLFIQILGFFSMGFITIIDNILLKIFFDITFWDAGKSMNWVISMYVLLNTCVLLLGIIGSFIAFNISNLKTGGYFITLLDIIFIYLFMYIFESADDSYLLYISLFIGVIVLFIALISTSALKKNKIIKCLH